MGIGIVILKKIVDLLFWPILQLQVERYPDLPTDRGALLAVNHIHALDPIIISYVLYPKWLNHIAKEEIFRVPLVASVVKALGAIPINRKRPGSDSIRQALDTLADSRYVCIFPQGTRRKTNFGEIKKGAARLALSGQVDIYPVAISGLEKVRFWGLFARPKVKIIFGEAISVAGRKNSKEEIDQLTEELQRKMTGLYNRIRL